MWQGLFFQNKFKKGVDFLKDCAQYNSIKDNNKHEKDKRKKKRRKEYGNL